MIDVPSGNDQYPSRSLSQLLLSFEGTISQNQFVIGIVVLLVCDFIFTLVMMALLGVPLSLYFEPRRDVATAKLVAYAAFAFPYMAVGVKRLKARQVHPAAACCVLLIGFLVAVENYHQVILRLKFLDFFGWLPTLLYVLGIGLLFFECAVRPERRHVGEDAAKGRQLPLHEDQ